MVESAISDKPETQNMFTEVKHAVEQCQDEELLTRLNSLPNGDLVAADERYNRGKKLCFTKYTNLTVQNQLADENTIKVALNQVIMEYNNYIINKKRHIY